MRSESKIMDLDLTDKASLPDYLQGLNPAQLKAATSVYGRVLLIAGAGSGKTFVLTCRSMYMVRNGIDPSQILQLTFTNKAAEEMKERIIRNIGAEGERITACTFHSFCANMLRRHAKLLDLDPGFVIVNGPDAEEVMSICKQEYLTDLKYTSKDVYYKNFPTKSMLLGIYSYAINHCKTLESCILDHNKIPDIYKSDVLEVMHRYEQYKKDHKFMDYDDLLNIMNQKLRTNKTFCEGLQDRYRYVSCDEYQDTNTLQFQILDAMTEKYGNLTVVGDDNQSIYAFRGARIDNILNFDEIYDPCKTIVMDTNYRSTQEILDLSNAMMQHATEGREKTLKGLTHGEKPKLVVVKDQLEEATVIANYIKHAERYSDIAVISRGANQSTFLELKLQALGIPFVKYGGKPFIEKQAVKDVLAFLRASIHIDDEIALYRILQLYPGIGKTYAQKISKNIASDGIPATLLQYTSRSFYTYLQECISVIEKIQDMKLDELLHYLIDYYYPKTKEHAIMESNMSDSKKDDERDKLTGSLEALQGLFTLAEKYRSTKSFVNDLMLDATRIEPGDADAVTITTIHSAKGLEYDTVFILDCIQGFTPRVTEDHEDYPEELRCMYVAVTRAKKKLYLMKPSEFTNYRGKPEYSELSYFIDYADVKETLDVKRIFSL